MILADTSVWVQHFRRGIPAFATALEAGSILMHPVVIGELATGNLAHRQQTLADLRRLPGTKVGTTEECLVFIETHQLHGRGIGWNDVQLLVAAKLSHDPLWTLDVRLAAAAAELGAAS
ncbi:PIN domain-containing protein [soil metagenome]|nr:type II toxin-antitoxin system VapC family toxin [Chthoniobacterales bacterium]